MNDSKEEKKIAGFIGLGDMGLSMALNLLKEGIDVIGFDLRDERMEKLREAGGRSATSPKEVGDASEAVFIMVMTGDQLYQVVCGENGLLESMKPNSTIIVTATVKPSEIKRIVEPARARSINLIDSPVSGGKGGADAGSLALMASGQKSVWERNQVFMQAVGGKIFHVGDEVGMGQTVKASLQALIGSTFTAIFESLVLGSKCGIKGQVLFDVFAASGVSSPLFKNCADLILDRRFKETGSQIKTMYKDLGITMDLARQSGVSMFTTAAAQELFQAGISMFPEEDNWSIVKLLEGIAKTEVHR